MSRRGWVIIAITAGALLAVAGLVVLVQLPDKPQTLSSATSPDGTWSIEVIAKQRFQGAYDIVVQIREKDGGVSSGGVMGLERDLAAAKRKYGVLFIDNTTAKVGGHTVKKPTESPQ